jgi:hypothetical protein
MITVNGDLPMRGVVHLLRADTLKRGQNTLRPPARRIDRYDVGSKTGVPPMQWRREENWAQWVDRTIDGETFMFHHLRSFDMPFVKPAFGDHPPVDATIRVAFDCHVVTERHTHSEEGPAYWRDTGGHCRVFNRARYEKSLILPAIISTLPSGQIAIYQAKSNNYMVWRPEGSQPGDAHYQAFFDLYKAPGQDNLLILYVQSAYSKDQPLAVQRERKMAFGRVCAELLGLVQKKEKGPRPQKKAPQRV